jgi:hypothetical protein
MNSIDESYVGAIICNCVTNVKGYLIWAVDNIDPDVALDSVKAKWDLYESKRIVTRSDNIIKARLDVDENQIKKNKKKIDALIDNIKKDKKQKIDETEIYSVESKWSKRQENPKQRLHIERQANAINNCRAYMNDTMTYYYNQVNNGGWSLDYTREAIKKDLMSLKKWLKWRDSDPLFDRFFTVYTDHMQHDRSEIDDENTMQKAEIKRIEDAEKLMTHHDAMLSLQDDINPNAKQDRIVLTSDLYYEGG